MPQILHQVVNHLTQLTSVFFVGHNCSQQTLAGVGLGHVLIGSFGLAFCFGLNSTLESKVARSYGGGHHSYELCGVWLNRGMFINTIMMIPMVFLYASSYQLLKSIGIDESLAKIA